MTEVTLPQEMLQAIMQQHDDGYQRQVQEAAERHRLDMLRFSAVLCGCDRRYDWLNPRPPQMDCIIHGQVPVLPDGRVLW